MNKNVVLTSLAIIVVFIFIFDLLDTMLSNKISVEMILTNINSFLESDLFRTVSPIIIILVMIVFGIKFAFKK